jgi:hypothetical protein
MPEPPAPVVSPPPDVVAAPPLPPEPVEVAPVLPPAPTDAAELDAPLGPDPEPAGPFVESVLQRSSTAPTAKPTHLTQGAILRELRCSSPFCRFNFVTPCG